MQYPYIFTGIKQDQAKYEKFTNALSFLDKFLENGKYAAGTTLTVADLSLAVSISTIQVNNFDYLKIKFF